MPGYETHTMKNITIYDNVDAVLLRGLADCLSGILPSKGRLRPGGVLTYRYAAAPLAPSLAPMNTPLLLFKLPRIKTATIEM